MSTCYTSSKSTSYLSFNYTKGDYQGLHQHLLLCDFTTCYLSHDIELVWSTIEHLIIDAMQLFIPVRKIHANEHPPWFNSDIRHNIKQLRTLRRRYKQHPTHHISCTINSLELTLQNKINAAKQSFEYNLINSHGTTKIFKYLKSIRKSNNVPSLIQFESSTANTDCAKANLFNQYFHSVFTIHLHFLTSMNCHLYKTLLTPLPSLLQTFMKLSFHWMSRNLQGQTKFLPESFVVVLRLFVSHFTICFHFHCVMPPYLTVESP